MEAGVLSNVAGSVGGNLTGGGAVGIVGRGVRLSPTRRARDVGTGILPILLGAPQADPQAHLRARAVQLSLDLRSSVWRWTPQA